MVRTSRTASLKRAALVLLTVSALSGCALVNEENRHLSRALEKHCWPESTGARLAAAPLYVPVWIAALAVDGVVINPILSAPKALGWASGFCGLASFALPFDIVAYPVKLLLFPAVFFGAEAVYCMVPL